MATTTETTYALNFDAFASCSFNTNKNITEIPHGYNGQIIYIRPITNISIIGSDNFCPEYKTTPLSVSAYELLEFVMVNGIWHGKKYIG